MIGRIAVVGCMFINPKMDIHLIWAIRLDIKLQNPIMKSNRQEKSYIKYPAYLLMRSEFRRVHGKMNSIRFIQKV